MATPTYTLIAQATVGASQNIVTFDNIDQGYKNLIFHYDLSTTNSSASQVFVRFNDLSSSYYNTYFASDRSAETDNNDSKAFRNLYISEDEHESVGELTLFDYSSTKAPSYTLTSTNYANSNRNDKVYAGSRHGTGQAITKVTFQCSGANFNQGGTIKMYGLVG